MMIASRSEQTGLTMIELMIGMLLSLILMAGVIQVFIGSKQSYRILEGTSVMQENGRFAMHLLKNNLRMADFWGGVERDAITGTPAITGACAADLPINGSGIFGIQGNVASPLGCIPATDYVPNTDILVVRYADANPVTAFTANNIYLQTLVGSQGRLLLSDGTIPASNVYDSNTGTINGKVGALVYPFHLEAYYIRACSDPSGGGSATACDAGDDGGDPIPTLVRVSLVDNALVTQPLLEGVENMQLQFGRDTSATSDGVVDVYETADVVGNAASANWNQVISVRISVMVRAPQMDGGFTDNNTYTMLDQNVTVNGVLAQKRYRNVYTTEVQVRNRVRS